MPIDTSLGYFGKNLFAALELKGEVESDLGMIVVIPCYHEPDLVSVLTSLSNCKPPKLKVEVIVVVNESESDSLEAIEANQNSLNSLAHFRIENQAFFQIHSLFKVLPQRHAGVGLARKIGMDEAAFRLIQSGNDTGAIVCLDADCKVSSNYFIAIEDYILTQENWKGASLYYEHDWMGNYPVGTKEGIINYELYLRYYSNALRWANYPFWYPSIGSSMMVSAKAYCQMGGMNRRKAGEDFYFLHKIMPIGDFGFVRNATVFPSPRVSHRVPFGTGKAMQRWLNEGLKDYPIYAWQSFVDLKAGLKIIEDELYKTESWAALEMKMPPSLRHYFQKEKWGETISHARKNSTTQSAFLKRIYSWLNGLKVLQYFHFARENFYPDVALKQTLQDFLIAQQKDINLANHLESCLIQMRIWDKEDWV